MYADDGSLLYEKIWLPEQRQGFFTDAGFANGSEAVQRLCLCE